MKHFVIAGCVVTLLAAVTPKAADAPAPGASKDGAAKEKESEEKMTKQNITPFLMFEGKAEEAINYYVSIFKNSKIKNITRYGKEGPGPEGTVLHATFVLDGVEVMA